MELGFNVASLPADIKLARVTWRNLYIMTAFGNSAAK
jgi:hypothetical protein